MAINKRREKETGTIINQQKRDKLKEIVITKLLKELGPETSEEIVKQEVNKFFSRNKINANDLKYKERESKKERMLPVGFEPTTFRSSV